MQYFASAYVRPVMGGHMYFDEEMSWNGSESASNGIRATPKGCVNDKRSKVSIISSFMLCILAGGIIVALFNPQDTGDLDSRVGHGITRPSPSLQKHNLSGSNIYSLLSKRIDTTFEKVLNKAQNSAKTSSTNFHDVGVAIAKKVRALGITAIDQLINMAQTSPCDRPPPPLPPITQKMEEDFRNILKKEIVTTEDDSDTVKAIKERLKENRKIIREYLDKGYTVKMILTEHMDLLSENQTIRQNVMNDLKAIEDSGDMKLASDYMTKVNIKLKQMGIEEVRASTPAADRAARFKQAIQKIREY